MSLSGSYQSPATGIPGLVPLSPQSFPMEFFRGDDVIRRLPILDHDGNVIDVTGGTAVWTLKNDPCNAEAILQKTLENGLVQVEPGLLEITLTAEETEDLLIGFYYHDIQVIDVDGLKTTAFNDVVSVKADLNREA